MATLPRKDQPETSARRQPHLSHTIQSPGEAAGSELRARVGEALRQTPHLNGHQVLCQEEAGVVVLHGRVSSYYQKQVAQEALKRLEGIEQIINELEVDWMSEISRQDLGF